MTARRVPFAVKRDDSARASKRWRVMRVGDYTVVSRHARKRDAIYACIGLIHAGADPGPVLPVSELGPAYTCRRCGVTVDRGATLCATCPGFLS